KRAVETIDTTHLVVQDGLGALLAVSVLVVEQRRPARQCLIQQGLAGGIVSDSRAPPLMCNEMGDSPFQTLLDGRSLFANYLRQVAHGGRVEVDIKGAGDDVES